MPPLLQLSAADIERLSAATTTLLSPQAYASSESWRDAARHAVANLLDADITAFLLLQPNERFAVAGPEFQEAAAAWVSEYHVLDTGFKRMQPTRGSDVYHITDLYDDVCSTSFYHEWVRRFRCFDSLAVAVAVGDAPLTATINCYHQDERSRFGARGRSMLRLVESAMRAGVEAAVRLQALPPGLGAQLDAAGLPLCICDATGRVVHETPGFTALCSAESVGLLRLQAVALARRVARVAHGTRAVANGRSTMREESVRAGATSFQTRAGSFTLVPTVLPELLAWRGPAVMVLARRRGPLTDEQLHTRFGLTQREIVVCRLLATGLTLGAAAAQLRISVHTVRHHTEHAYAKLGVRSRVALSTMLAGSASPPT